MSASSTQQEAWQAAARSAVATATAAPNDSAAPQAPATVPAKAVKHTGS